MPISIRKLVLASALLLPLSFAVADDIDSSDSTDTPTTFHANLQLNNRSDCDFGAPIITSAAADVKVLPLIPLKHHSKHTYQLSMPEKTPHATVIFESPQCSLTWSFELTYNADNLDYNLSDTLKGPYGMSGRNYELRQDDTYRIKLTN